MDISQILHHAITLNASDIFIIAGLPLTYKINGRQLREGEPLHPDDTHALISAIYKLCGRNPDRFAPEDSDDDFSFAIQDLGRFRANVLHQRGTLAVVLRVNQIPMHWVFRLKLWLPAKK